MPTSQRFLAPLLLLILAGPLAMIAAAADLGLPSDTLWHWTELSLPFLGIPGGVLVIRGLSIAPKPGQPMDVSRFESKGRSILLAWAFIIGPIALFVAAAISPIVGLFIVSVAVLWVLLWTPPLLRRVQVETSGLIQRNPATVFSFVADSRNLPLYAPTVLSVEKLTEGPIGPGTQFHSKMQLTPATTAEVIAQIVDYEPNLRMTSRVISSVTSNLDVVTFTPDGGGTILRSRFETEVSFNLALIGAAFRIPRARRLVMAAQQSSWLSLKQVLENTESGPPRT